MKQKLLLPILFLLSSVACKPSADTSQGCLDDSAALIEQSAQTVSDIDSLGDIWAVTIDNSFSMRNENGRQKANFPALLADVRNRLSKSPLMNTIDWERDRFLFFHSGMSSRVPPSGWDTLFIHHLGTETIRFSGPEQLADYVHDLMKSKLGYNFYISFISQIRLFTLKKAIDYLNSIDQSLKYRNINVLTISDDKVDQRDLWGTDYKNLRTKAPNAVKYLQYTSARYIYNPLNGWGGGQMDESWADENGDMHIWAYSYSTSQSQRINDSLADYFRVRADNGRDFSMVLNTDDSVVLCRIDSVSVNNRMHYLNQYFTDILHDTFAYRNSFPINSVKVYGKVQMAYYDSILGSHYRTVDFVQSDKVLTRLADVVWRTFLVVVAAFLLFWLVYLLFLLPRRSLFSVYDAATGSCTIVRRGYRWHWKNDVLPLMTMETGKGLRILVRQDSHVRRTKRLIQDNEHKGDLLIVGGKELLLSVDSTYHFNTSSDNIESHFYDMPNSYPTLLKRVYRETFDYELYKMRGSKNPITRVFGWLSHKMYHIICGTRHYYSLSITGKKSISIGSPILQDKFFIVDNVRDNKVVNDDDILVHKTLLAYYGYKADTTTVVENRHRDSKALLTCTDQGGRRLWNVFLMDNVFESKTSVLSVRWVYTYTLAEKRSDYVFEKKSLLKIIRKHYGCTPSYLYIRCSIKTAELRAMSFPQIFNISESESKHYLMLVSTGPESKTIPGKKHNHDKEEFLSRLVIQMYDPFVDGFNRSSRFKFIHGHEYYVYASILPASLIRSEQTQYFAQLSNEVVNKVSKYDNPNAEFVIATDRDRVKRYWVNDQPITIKEGN